MTAQIIPFPKPAAPPLDHRDPVSVELARLIRELGSLEFSKLLVEKAEVAVSPGVAFGEHGEGYVRIALVENEQRIRQAARNLRRFLDTGVEKLHNVVPLATRR